MPTPLAPPEAVTLYRLIFADVAQCAQVILNSLRHDLLLAGYLAAGCNLDYGAREAKKVIPAIEALIDETERVRGLAWEAAARPPEDEAAFFHCRHELGRAIAALLHKGGVVHQQLRAFVDASAPDMVTQWTRLETADSHGAATVRTLAESCAARLRDWAGRRFGHAPESDVLIDFAHDSDVRNDGPQIDGRVYHHLTIPYWMVHLFRYITVVAHEVGHPFVDTLDELKPLRDRNVDFVVDLFDDLGISDRFGRPLRVDIAEGFARRVLAETLADALALHLVGPSYVVALGCYLLGTHEWANETGARLSVPVYVRLRTLLSLVEDGDPPADPALAGILAAVGAAADARVARLRAGNPVEALQATLQVELQPIAELFVRQVLEAGVPDVATGPAAAVLAGVETLWAEAARVANAHAAPEDSAPGAPALVRALEEIPEGKILVEGELKEAAALGVSFGDAWALLRMYLRSEGTCEPDTSALLDAISRFARPTGTSALGLAGLVLGPCDAVVLRAGIRVRRGDQVDHGALGGLRPYVRRRLLLEVTRVAPPGEPELYVASGVAPAGALALTELQVEDREWGPFLLEFLKTVAAVEGVRPVAVFRGVGWANLVVVWGIESAAGLTALHEHVLATNDPNLHRSVTQLLTKTVNLGDASREQSWDQVDWPPGTGLDIVASVRTNGAAKIASLRELLDGARQGETVEITCRKVFGLYDAFVRFAPTSGAHVREAADILWRSVANGTLRRSNSMIRFPDL